MRPLFRISMRLLTALDVLCKWVTGMCGVIACLAMVLLLLNVFIDVVMRYGFNDVSIGMQELEWHLFALVFLLGTPYAMQQDGHVRVDILFERWSEKSKAVINLLGALCFVLPFTLLVAWYGIDFAYEAYEINEGSGDPGGLPYRWIIKSAIPLSFGLMALAGLGMMTQAIFVLTGQSHYQARKKDGLA